MFVGGLCVRLVVIGERRTGLVMLAQSAKRMNFARSAAVELAGAVGPRRGRRGRGRGVADTSPADPRGRGQADRTLVFLELLQWHSGAGQRSKITLNENQNQRTMKTPALKPNQPTINLPASTYAILHRESRMPHFKMSVAFVTPELAQILVANSASGNSPVNSRKLNRLIETMRAGKFEFTATQSVST